MGDLDIRYRYSINNITNLSIDLQSPMMAMPLPQAEEGDIDNILVKAEGNAMRIIIQWDLIKESASVVTAYGSSPTTAISSSKYGGSINTPDKMVQFLTDEFQNKGVEYKFQLEIPADAPFAFAREGNIEKITFQKTGRSPVTWKANLTFVSGEIVTVGA